uniref:Uncharacterized protein LOC104215213 n=1 Tax=Nicotiana sylvestris TaxID=4096 RepID=A0A1U7V4Z5_NICSY|nr:PREDICTED: uncharacterized protein LOC104215213 [Nicotiana sylvestris]
MVAPPNFKEGQSTYRPPRFNNQFYGWWKTRMHDFNMVDDSELWDVICDGPSVPTKFIGDFAVTVPKTRRDMHTRFTSIINELHSLGEIIPRNKLVRKILIVLPSSWESKVNIITEAKDQQKLTMDELVGNLKTYEMKRKKDNEGGEPKREKNLVPKMDINDSGGENADMA